VLVFLARVRDFLVALALAWIGVSIETQVERVERASSPPCADDAQSCRN
jgi:hypothetical protein